MSHSSLGSSCFQENLEWSMKLAVHCYHLLKLFFFGSSTVVNCSFFHEATEKIIYISFPSKKSSAILSDSSSASCAATFNLACRALALQLSLSSCCLCIFFSKVDFICVSNSYLSKTLCLLASKLGSKRRFFLLAPQYFLLSHPCQ